LEQALKCLSLDPAPAPTYGYPDGKGIHPCGESCPATDLERSEDDRRVELVFYERGKWSPAVPPAAGKKVEKKTDPVSEKKWEKKEAKTAVPPPEEEKLTLKITSPEKTPHKQYVNLAQDEKDQGPELKIGADVAGAADGKTVVFEATCEGQKGKVEVATRRKIWYQFTHEKGLNLPDPDNSRKAYEDVGIELIGCSAREFEKTDTHIPDRTFYKEYIIECYFLRRLMREPSRHMHSTTTGQRNPLSCRYGISPQRR